MMHSYALKNYVNYNTLGQHKHSNGGSTGNKIYNPINTWQVKNFSTFSVAMIETTRAFKTNLH